jgi:hypothetical protein
MVDDNVLLLLRARRENDLQVLMRFNIYLLMFRETSVKNRHPSTSEAFRGRKRTDSLPLLPSPLIIFMLLFIETLAMKIFGLFHLLAYELRHL